MEQKWYAIYTKMNYEEKLCDSINSFSSQTGFECESYLPTVIEEKQWSDRVKRKRKPLFSNYLFVKHDHNGFDKFKRMTGFCDYVRFEKYPATIDQNQIDMIKTAIKIDKNIICGASKLIRGEKVRISKGPLADYEGVLVEDQGNNKVAIEVKYFNQYVLVNVALDYVIKL